MCFTSTSMETVEEFASDDNNNNCNEHLKEDVHHDNEKSIENVDEDDDEGNEDEINDNYENDEGIGKQQVKCGYNKSRKQLNTSASHVNQVHDRMEENEQQQEEEEEEYEEYEEDEEEQEESLLESPIESEEQHTRPRLVGVSSTIEYHRENDIDTNNRNNNTTEEQVNINKLVHKGKMINLHDLQREREIIDKINEKSTSISHFNITTDVNYYNENNNNANKKKNVYNGNEAIAETSPQDLNSQSMCESESGRLVEHSRHFSHSSISSQRSLRDADQHTFVNSAHGNKGIIIDHNNSNSSSSRRQFDSNNKTNTSSNSGSSKTHNHELEHQQANSSKFTFESLSPYREEQLEQQPELQFSASNTTQQIYQPRYNSGVSEFNILPPPPLPPQHPSSLPSMFLAHNTNAPISSYPNLYTYNNSSRNNTTLNSATTLHYNTNNNNNYNYSENYKIKSSVNNVRSFNNYVDTVRYGHSNNQIESFKNNIHHMPHSFSPSALSAVTAMYDTNTLMSNTTNESINNYCAKNIMCCNTTEKAIGRLHYHISEFTSWPIWLCGSLHPLLLKEKNEQTQMEQTIAEEQLVGNASIPSLEQRTDDEENEASNERRRQSHIMLSVEDMTLKDYLMRELIGCDEYRYNHTDEVMTENTNTNNNSGGIIEQHELELCNNAEEVSGDVPTQAADLTNKTNYNGSTLFTSDNSATDRINAEFDNHACDVNGADIDTDNVMHYPIQLSSTEPTKSEQFSEPLFSPATNTNYSSHDESDGDVQQRELNGQYTNELQELI